MKLMERWQLKLSAKEQLRGSWGNMALKSFLMYIIPIGIVWAFMIVVMVVGFTMTMFSFAAGSKAPYLTTEAGTLALTVIATVILYAALLFVMMALAFGFVDSCIRLRNGEVTGVGVIFGRFGMLPKIIKLTLFLLVALVPYMVICGICGAFPNVFTFLLMLAAAVGYIYVLLRVSMCTYILLENPYTTAWAAVKQSWYMMSGHSWRYFVLLLSFLGWMLLAALTMGIGMFWLMPYMEMTTVNFYYDLKQNLLAAQE